MVSHSQVHVLRWSIPVMAKGLFPRAWVKKSFYFQVMNAYWSIIAPPRWRLAIKMTRRWLRACAGSGSLPCHTLTAGRKHAQHRGCRDACQMTWWKIPEECVCSRNIKQTVVLLIWNRGSEYVLHEGGKIVIHARRDPQIILNAGHSRVSLHIFIKRSHNCHYYGCSTVAVILPLG